MIYSKTITKIFILVGPGIILFSFIVNFCSAVSLQLNAESYLSQSASGRQRYPVSAYANGVHLVVWQEGNETVGADSQIRGLIVADDGTYGNSFLISNAADVQEHPAITTDGANFFVVWQDYRNGSDYDVYGARVTAGGQVLDANGIAIATGAGNQSMPDVGFDGANYLVVWMDNRVVPESYHLRAARVSVGGNLLDASSVYLAGNIDATNLNQYFSPSGNMLYVPMLSFPKISCRNQACIVSYIAKEGADPGEKPRFVRITTSAGIAINGSPILLARDTPETWNVYQTYDVSSYNGSLSMVTKADGTYMMGYSGGNQKGAKSEFVAALPIDINSGNPPATLTVQQSSAGGYPNKVVAVPDGNRVFMFWADFSGIITNPTTYSLKGAIVNSGNSVSTFSIFSDQSVYRGFPHASLGGIHGLLVYEKDAGAGGTQLAGLMFDKNNPSWNIIPVSTPTPTPTFTPTPTPTPGFSSCDLNKDSRIDILDFQLLVNVILGISPNTGIYDLNKDTRTDILDIQTLVNVILGRNSCP